MSVSGKILVSKVLSFVFLLIKTLVWALKSEDTFHGSARVGSYVTKTQEDHISSL